MALSRVGLCSTFAEFAVGCGKNMFMSPGRQELPATVARSSAKAQRTWIAAHDSAVKTYGEGRRAHQTAMAALKHSFEKVGDHWEPKASPGPSDQRAASGRGRSHGGVDANSSAAHLRQVAARLGIRGRWRMRKSELVEAIERASR